METKMPSFTVQTIYLKDLSFECPASGMTKVQVGRIRFDAEFETKATTQEENLYEVSLSLTGKGINDEDEIMYLVEVTQGGTFYKEGEIPEELIKKATLADCPTVLFPYLRETVDSVLVKGGWPPITIAPVDFSKSYLAAQNS